MVDQFWFLALAAVLFSLGLLGALAKRNVIAVLLCLELMLNAAGINFVVFNRFAGPQEPVGQIFTLFVITIAAAEIGVALAIVIAIYRQRLTANLDKFNFLKW